MLKRILLLATTRKNETKLRKTEKTLKKLKKTPPDESDFSKNEIEDLNSLKPLEFESKTNNRVINSSSSDDQKQPLVAAMSTFAPILSANF